MTKQLDIGAIFDCKHKASKYNVSGLWTCACGLSQVKYYEVSWHCAGCGIDAISDADGYSLGDEEPCIHCNGGITKVVKLGRRDD